MYSACLYCQNYLGRNELLPGFPIGRRLAFDSAKGRLWVICRSCARWNLSPLEERWEAIEECERRFRRTHIRVSTPNIGLVELREGLTLIRIGKPLFPEFAAWRYGRRFKRRRLKSSLVVGAAIGAAIGTAAGAVAAGFGLATYWAAYGTALWIVDEGPKRRPVTSFRLGSRLFHLTQDDAEATRIFTDGVQDRFGIALHHSEGVDLLRGPDVKRVLSHVIPTLTPFGGARDEISGAIQLVDRAGSADVCVADTLERAGQYHGWFTRFPVETRLALEMSLQEESERRALEGELEALERAWRDAEQLAAIADSLLTPPDVLERIMGLRNQTRRPGFAIT